MPIYEYECTGCNRVITVKQSVHDEPLKTCASCGGDLRRIIFPSAIQFKGSGWYVTDYARKESQSEAKKGEEEGKAEDKSKDTRQDSVAADKNRKAA